MSCSLKWLCRILSESFFLEELEERRLLSKGAIQKMFLEPYSHGRLKKETIDLLTDPSIYLNAYLTIYSGGKVEEDSFECLIHNLAKKGGYVLEDNDIVVNGSMLAQKVPFREVIILCCGMVWLYHDNVRSNDTFKIYKQNQSLSNCPVQSSV